MSPYLLACIPLLYFMAGVPNFYFTADVPILYFMTGVPNLYSTAGVLILYFMAGVPIFLLYGWCTNFVLLVNISILYFWLV